MFNYPAPLAKLITELAKLPGVGTKTAQRLAFYILAMPDSDAFGISDAIAAAKRELNYCTVCGNLTDADPCVICSDKERDQTLYCVVESPRDVSFIERMREYKGYYHVLNGVIDPMSGIGPDDINLESLLRRITENDDAREVIIATNPNIEGEATARYIAKLIKPFGIRVTRIAHGVPFGGDLEYTDDLTLSKAIEFRQEL